MVVVAVALWSLYQQHLQQQQEGDGQGPKPPDSASAPPSGAAAPLPTTRSQSFGAYVMEQALSCASPAATTDHDPEDDVGASDSDDGADDAPHAPLTAPPPPQRVLPDVFTAAVKRDWMAAVFGAPEEDHGTAAAANYMRGIAGPCVSYQATIPPLPAPDGSSNSHNGSGDRRIGLTICRLSLGVYAKRVDPRSEAYLAGVRPGAVLVSINGVSVLGDPSARALERLWQYEGYFRAAPTPEGGGAAPAAGGTGGAAAPTPSDAAAAVPSTPVHLVFFHRGRTRSVLLLARPPSGIAWAPCVNLPLLKRVHGPRAREAGIHPGGLLAGVEILRPEGGAAGGGAGGVTTFWTADHVEMAQALTRAARNETAAIRVTCCYTPRASRSSYFEVRRHAQLDTAPATDTADTSRGQPQGPFALFNGFHGGTQKRPLLATKELDGVHVKFHPLDFGLCTSRMLVADGTDEQSQAGGLQHKMAKLVAAGLVEGPSGIRQQPLPAELLNSASKIGASANAVVGCSPCPVLTGSELMQSWDPFESLVYCLQLRMAKFDDERLCWNLAQAAPEDSALTTLNKLASQSSACQLFGAYLLQCIGMICAPVVDTESADEKKTDDASFDNSVNSGFNKSLAQTLTSIILKLSRKDPEFRQRLYFLLRSYISTLETPRPSQEGPRKLTALLDCLELLRFAENELAKHQVSEQLNGADSSVLPSNSNSMPRYPDGREAASVTDLSADLHSMEMIKHNSERQTESSEFLSSPRKKRGWFARFRRKKVDKRGPRSTLSLATPYSPVHGLYRASQAASVHGARQAHASSPAAKVSSLSPRQAALIQDPSVMYENMSDFLGELDRICQTIERSLQKSFRQKMADWAMLPWSPSKDSALAQVTQLMRDSLKQITTNADAMLLVNPVDSSELLSSIDHDECYILPSAHFPILLTFNVSERRSSDLLTGEERLYRTKVELVALRGRKLPTNHSFTIHGAVAGAVLESGPSTKLTTDGKQQTWKKNKALIFDSQSSWGAPQTLSLRLSSRARNEDGSLSEEATELGFGWLDLSKQFKSTPSHDALTSVSTADIWPLSPGVCSFDEHGYFQLEGMSRSDRFVLEMKITTESIGFGDDFSREPMIRKRMLLYKHDDDLRQETFAIQFVTMCGSMFKASGLDMKLLSFQCIPVGTRRGFVEWVPGSVPLSEICQPYAASSLLSNERPSISEMRARSMLSKAGTKYESFRRLGGQQVGTFRRLSDQKDSSRQGPFNNNPIQDYLRGVAFDPKAPYMIRNDVMDTYIKSAAGYSVITYVLGVGDRHLDNLLLHESGAFFHCDYSFILGSDPKMYLPVRVTEDMVLGMGGRDSDNYARFLSTVGAAFLVLRRPENARALMSLVRLMEYSCVPDISVNQSIDQAILGLRDRLKLDLLDHDAVIYIENVVESSQSSAMWKAIDAIHTLGKKF